jgi:glycine cleavage system H protein
MEFESYNMPDELYYDPNHYWVRQEGDLLVMGMDDFARKLAGQIVFVQLPEEGKALKQGKKFASVESGKWLGKVYAPVTGELAGVNEELETNPGLINQDCYGSGWMYKVKPDDMGELQNLLHGTEAVQKWLIGEIEKFAKGS